MRTCAGRYVVVREDAFGGFFVHAAGSVADSFTWLSRTGAVSGGCVPTHLYF